MGKQSRAIRTHAGAQPCYKKGMKHIVSMTLIVALMSAPAMAAERYLCLPELSTGFKWSETEKRWNQENFSTDVTKYLVEQSKVVGQEDSFIVKQIGSDYPAHNSCKR